MRVVLGLRADAHVAELVRALHRAVSLLLEHAFLVSILNHEIMALIRHSGITSTRSKIQLHHLNQVDF